MLIFTYVLFPFSATGTGREMDLDQRVGGRCDGYQSDGDRGNHYKMKLKLRVCADEEAATEKCPICLTAACYNHGTFCLSVTSLSSCLGWLRQIALDFALLCNLYVKGERKKAIHFRFDSQDCDDIVGSERAFAVSWMNWMWWQLKLGNRDA